MRSNFKLYRKDEKVKSLSPVISMTQRDGRNRYVDTHFHTTDHFELLRQNRFILIFPQELNIPNTLVKSTSRPTCRFEINANDRIASWDDIKVTFYDPIVPSIQQTLHDIIHNEVLRQHRMFFKLQSLDPIGTVVNEWSIFGFISEMNFGQLDYTSDLDTEVSLTIVVNNAVLIL